MSIILEVLQRVDIEDLEQAVKLARVFSCTSFTDCWHFRFHFDSLAHDNSASSQKIHDIVLPAEPQTTSPSGTPSPIILHGEQTVRKFNRTIPDRVHILVALYRIKAKGVDLVLTANIPTSMTKGDSWSDRGVLQQSQPKFGLAAESLKILDFGLFA